MLSLNDTNTNDYEKKVSRTDTSCRFLTARSSRLDESKNVLLEVYENERSTI